MKETQTAIVDLEVFNEGLLRLQQLSGEVSFLKVLPIVQALQKSIIPPPEPSPEHEEFIAKADAERARLDDVQEAVGRLAGKINMDLEDAHDKESRRHVKQLEEQEKAEMKCPSPKKEREGNV